MLDGFSQDLRWILAALGAVCVAGVYLYTIWTHRQEKKRLEHRREPGLAPPQHKHQASDPLSNPIPEPGNTVSLYEAPEAADDRIDNTDATQTAHTATPDAEKIIVLYVEAKQAGQAIAGSELLRFVADKELVQMEGSDKTYFIDKTGYFYITNLFQPGTFDWESLHTGNLKGLSFFFQLPLRGANATDIFAQMHQCASQLAVQTGTQVYDENHETFSDAKLREIEAELSRYDQQSSF